ncbi:pseudouridine synthase [uncultured Parasutterella sp.]|jgi:tRNA pseudouridine65 synthase|uniref:pseudouridine synthase n=1 Tax=uncultured Parasutterella sp. TaxID=1263098 RepID=UPI0025FCDAA2|nr:pseudouridine synthase [uncultured Parasutterella sp.]
MTVLKILYQDDDLVAVSKPEKMLTHRTEIANGDTEFALQLLRDQIGRRVNPVYRLDRGTSGVLLFGLDGEIVSALNQQTHETFHKRYYAVVRGWAPEGIEIRHALKPPVDPYLRIQKTEAQDALSYLHRLAEAEVPVSSGKFDTTRLSLVLLELATGRRHQLRRHLKHLAHPIIGDATYGKGPLNRALAEYFGGDRLLLHCGRISFIHPRTQEQITIDDEPSGLMRQVVDRLGWGNYLHASYSSDWHLFDYSDLLVK